MNDSSVRSYRANIELFSKVNEFAVAFNNANSTNSTMAPIDFRDKEIIKFLHDLEEKDVKYLLVGGFAMAFQGYVRATHDLDLWIKDDVENLEKLKIVLSENGVSGIEKVKNLQLAAGFTEFKVGASGFVIDPITTLKAFSAYDFDQCYARSKTGEFSGIHFRVIHSNDLLKEKEATNRLKDQADIEHLKDKLKE